MHLTHWYRAQASSAGGPVREWLHRSGVEFLSEYGLVALLADASRRTWYIPVMRLATWNINGVRARTEYILHWLREVRPDVVGFQELKAPDDKFPREVIAEAGYHALIHGQKSWNGVAILTREPATVLQRGLPGQESMGARLISAEVGGITFITVYVPNGKTVEHEDFERKLVWMKDLKRWLTEHHSPDQPLVLCGDFNIVPTGRDTWNDAPGTMFQTDRERECLESVMAFGLQDLYRMTHPDQTEFTWWDYRGGAFYKRQGLRIDFLLATAPVAARVQEVHQTRDWRKKVDGLTASDHAPVWVDLVD